MKTILTILILFFSLCSFSQEEASPKAKPGIIAKPITPKTEEEKAKRPTGFEP